MGKRDRTKKPPHSGAISTARVRVTEIMIAFRKTIPLVHNNIHQRSRLLALIEEESSSFDEA